MFTNKLFKNFYNERSSGYDDWMRKECYNSPRVLANGIAVVTGKRKSIPKVAIDAAVGTGKMARELKRLFDGCVVHGYDNSEGMLEICNENGGADVLEVCNLELRWPSDDEMADIVTCAGALELLSGLDNFMSEAHRSLKTQGLLGVTFAISGYPRTLFAPEGKIYTPEQFKQTVNQHGFRVARYREGCALKNSDRTIVYGYMVAEKT